MSRGSPPAVIALSALLVLAGCAGDPAGTPEPTDIVDERDLTGTPTSQDRNTASAKSPDDEPEESTDPPAEDGAGATAESETTAATPTATATRTVITTRPATREPTDTATETPSPTAISTPTSTARTATVVDVVDGDTVKLRFPNGSRETARLLGVDTPETHGPVDPGEWAGVPDSEAGRSCLAEWGERATRFTTDRLLGKTVIVEFDANEPRRGYYGRLLVYLSVDSRSFNDDLVRQGYARVYRDSRFTEKSAFLGYEEMARSNQRGAWACRDARATPSETASPTASPTRTAEPTDTSTATPTAESSTPADESLVVDAIHADAEGNDHENENDEWIRFRNAGDATLDLSGWTVADEAGHTYRIPDGTTLAPGGTITLYTGNGQDTDDALYWGSDAAIWNNGGDTIIVDNAAGETVLSREY